MAPAWQRQSRTGGGQDFLFLQEQEVIIMQYFLINYYLQTYTVLIEKKLNRHLIEKKQQSAYFGKNQQLAINKEQSSLFNISVAVFILLAKMPFLLQSQNPISITYFDFDLIITKRYSPLRWPTSSS